MGRIPTQSLERCSYYTGITRLFLRIRNTVSSFRHGNFKSYPGVRIPGLLQGYFRDREDFPGEEEAGATFSRMFPGEHILFFCCRNSSAIGFNQNRDTIRVLPEAETDTSDIGTVQTDGCHEGQKDILEQGIGIYLHIRQIYGPGDIRKIQVGNGIEKSVKNGLPPWLVNAKVLVLF